MERNIFLKISTRFSKPRLCHFVNSAFKRNNFTGFTLVELLVTIAIIVILLNLSLASLSKIKTKSQQVSCINNLRQLSLSFSNYLADNGGVYPQWSPNGTGLGTDFWTYYFSQNYFGGKTKVFHCPTQDSQYLNRYFSLTYSDYGYNYLNIGSGFRETDTINDAFSRSAKDIDILKPSSTILLADSSHGAGAPDRGMCIIYDWSLASYRMIARHGGSINILWCDSHVSSESCSNPSDPYSTVGTIWVNPSVWSRDNKSR